MRTDRRTPILSPEEKKVFVDTFTRTGFTGGINWYRNFSRNWQRSKGLDHTVRVPSLMIMAENDAVLPPSAADGMEKLVPDLEKHLVRGSGNDAAEMLQPLFPRQPHLRRPQGVFRGGQIGRYAIGR